MDSDHLQSSSNVTRTTCAKRQSTEEIRRKKRVKTQVLKPVQSETPRISSIESNLCSAEKSLLVVSLEPNQQYHPMIRVRVLLKPAVIVWKKPGSQGRLFSIIVTDSTSDIRVVGFNQAVEKFYDMFEIGRSYELRDFKCKIADPRFNHTASLNEIVLSVTSEVKKSAIDCSNAPEGKFDTMLSISEMPPERWVNAIGVLCALSEAEVVGQKKKDSTEQLRKREVRIIDESLKVVMLTLWNKDHAKIHGPIGSVITLRRVRTKLYAGQISLIFSDVSAIEFQSSSQRAKELALWWKVQGETLSDATLSMQARNENLSIAESVKKFQDRLRRADNAPLIFGCAVEILEVNKQTLMYSACTSRNCSRKVGTSANEKSFCSNCQVEIIPEWRYVLKLRISDASQEVWATAFSEVAEELLGCEAATLHAIMMDDTEEGNRIVASCVGKRYSAEIMLRLQESEGASQTVFVIKRLTSV